jgi:hypothetical protein
MVQKLPPAPTGRGQATFLLIIDLWEQIELAKPMVEKPYDALLDAVQKVLVAVAIVDFDEPEPPKGRIDGI